MDALALLNTTNATSAQPPPVASVDALIASVGTGVAVVDALLCMVISLVVQQMLTALQSTDGSSLFARLCNFVLRRKRKGVVTRVIEITQRFNQYGNKLWDYDQKNHLLQKAITLYLADVLNLRNKDATYDLLEKPKRKKLGATAKTLANDDDDSCDGDTSVSSGSDAGSDASSDDDGAYCGAVSNLNVEVMPPLNTWVEVEKDILFMQEHAAAAAAGDGKGPSTATVRFMFMSSATDGSERIDALIKTAYKRYQDGERQKHIEDKARYFYIQSGTKGTSGGDDGGASTVAYKRYALGEDKTFENLFFEEKATVLQLLDNFTNKSGKFAIKGFPYKLGLLLHGPPGTGKTSLIKAVAQHTKRHIVTISLGKIKTNQELLDALFDMKFAVQGLDTPVEMAFEDVVFVMEDIDCASSIVNARTDTDPVSGKNKRMLESQKKAAEKDDGVDVLLDGAMGPLMKPKSKSDKLNLSGLLNVLDGVIDCPGRIVIMTTNHPEKLDPALVRPGRVNKKLLLSYMGAPHIQEMIEYYCATPFTDAASAKLAAIVASSAKQFTPAEVEEACAEFDDVDSILAGLAASH